MEGSYNRLSGSSPRFRVMDATTAVDEEVIEGAFERLRRQLRTEHEQLTAERRAFSAFADRIREIQPSEGRSTGGPSAVRGGGLAVDAGVTTDQSTLAAVRRAYEETVLALPFYDDVYGDDYAESLRAELGTEIALSLTRPNCFSAAAKRATLSAVERAREERRAFLTVCERERDSVDAAAETLVPLAAELDTIDATPMHERTFGALDACRTRLAAIEDRCKAVAAERQSHLADQRDRQQLPVSCPDVPAYVYDADANHPVISLVLDVLEAARALRRRAERAIARQ